ncbi:MAG: hypothetical protein WCO96_06845 [Actinomycetes bacterium]
MLSGVAVASTLFALALIDPGTALWFSAPLSLLWLLVTGLTRPVERMIHRIRGRWAAARTRAQQADRLPNLPLVVPRVGRLIAAALAVRPPPVAAPLSQ